MKNCEIATCIETASKPKRPEEDKAAEPAPPIEPAEITPA